MSWKIVARPEGRNGDGTNRSGIVIGLAGGGSRTYGYEFTEMTRVAFERANSKHPDVPFAEQLSDELNKAREAITFLNGLSADAEALQ